MVTGHSGQFTPGGYLSTVKHTALAGIEPTTFRLLVRRATSIGLPRPPSIACIPITSALEVNRYSGAHDVPPDGPDHPIVGGE